MEEQIKLELNRQTSTLFELFNMKHYIYIETDRRTDRQINYEDADL